MSSMRRAGTHQHESTQVKVQANLTREQCVELYSDTTGKINEKTKNKRAAKSPVVVLTYF